MSSGKVLSTARLALAVAHTEHDVRRAVRQNLIKPAGRMGRAFLFNSEDAQEIKRILDQHFPAPEALPA